MAWWVNITPEVVRGVEQLGFQKPSAAEILRLVEHYLSHHGEDCGTDRWDKCPDRFFVYTHVLIESGRIHTLDFFVDDSSRAVSVLNVAWVEHTASELF